MLIRSEFAIEFALPRSVAVVAMLRIHPSLDAEVRVPEALQFSHNDSVSGESCSLSIEDYLDRFGNRCSRFVGTEGGLRLTGSVVTEQDGLPDPINTGAVQHQIEHLPSGVLEYLLSSRYCQVDSLTMVAGDLFGHTTPGWARAIYIRDWVHDKVRFDYKTARSSKTALDVFTEREGVCRDFQHLAITMSRAMNIPARYATGYLGDIRRPYSGAGDFSAWYEVFLDGRWWTMDARHNDNRAGRVLMATGRDATDVAITTSFGIANLTNFYVESYEVDALGNTVPLPGGGVRNQPWVRELSLAT